MTSSGVYSDSRWELYASGDAPERGTPLRFFGPLSFAQQDRTARRVVKVLLEVDPDGEYWAWLSAGAWQPSCYGASEREMARWFAADDLTPAESEEAGLGRVLRLRVTILEEVNVRKGRYGWTAAMT